MNPTTATKQAEVIGDLAGPLGMAMVADRLLELLASMGTRDGSALPPDAERLKSAAANALTALRQAQGNIIVAPLGARVNGGR